MRISSSFFWLVGNILILFFPTNGAGYFTSLIFKRESTARYFQTPIISLTVKYRLLRRGIWPVDETVFELAYSRLSRPFD